MIGNIGENGLTLAQATNHTIDLKELIYVSEYNDHKNTTKRPIASELLMWVLFCILIGIAFYWFSYDHILNPELIAVIEMPPEVFPQGIYGEEWHSVYGEYGLYPGTWIHPHEYYRLYSEGWPEMDFQQYTYIITYGQEIESLSYKIGNVIDSPSFTGAKEGHMVLQEAIDPMRIFIYRIPRVRINNPNI